MASKGTMRVNRRRRLLIGLIVVVTGSAAIAVACTGNPTVGFRMDPVSASGPSPFSPPVGTDQDRATPPANVSGTFPGNTVGLYGGTMRQSSCDQKAMATFLANHPDKAAAWAGVLGIQPADIAPFVNQLTPVTLRADTLVTNHGFANGHATTVPAVLQTGTAVLINSFGAPVTRCFCGNPLTAPPKHRRASFTGTPWPGFNATSVIVVQATTVVINQFILVPPTSGPAFERPHGTDGGDDQLAPTATPSGSSSGGAGSTTSPSIGALPAFPSANGATTAPAPANTSGSTSASAAAVPSASWVVGNCFLDRGTGDLTARGTVRIRNNDPASPHSYRVTVAFGPSNARYAEEATSVDDVAPNDIGSQDVSTMDVSAAANGLADGPVDCEITQIEDENQAHPEQGAPIDPPSPIPPSGVTQPSTSEPATVPQPSPS